MRGKVQELLSKFSPCNKKLLLLIAMLTIYIFSFYIIKYSPKRETILDGVKDNIEEENSNEERQVGISKLCPSRWYITVMQITT